MKLAIHSWWDAELPNDEFPQLVRAWVHEILKDWANAEYTQREQYLSGEYTGEDEEEGEEEGEEEQQHEAKSRHEVGKDLSRRYEEEWWTDLKLDSPEEYQILRSRLAGKSYQTIAAEMGVSKSTVERKIQKIEKRLESLQDRS